MFKSISQKLIFQVGLQLALSIGVCLIVTLWVVSEAQNKDLQGQMETANLVSTTTQDADQSKLKEAAGLIGLLPILTTVVENGDPGTIKSTLMMYKRDLKLAIVETMDDEGEFLVGTTEEEPEDNTGFQSIIEQASEGEVVTGIVPRHNKLLMMAAAPIGLPSEPSGILVIGNYLDHNYAKKLESLTQGSISFLVDKKVVGTSKKEADVKLYENDINQLALSKGLKDFETSSAIIHIKELKGPDDEVVGQMVVDLSKAESIATLKRIIQTVLGLGLLNLLVSMIASYFSAQKMARPIKSLDAMTTEIIKTDDLTKRAEPKGKDEIASLGNSFNYFLETILENRKKLDDYSRNLEDMVEEKTQQINMILENVKTGFLLIDKSLKVQPGYTKSCKELLGASIKSGQRLSQTLKLDPRMEEHFNCCLDQVFDDFMPEEVTLSQAPQQIQMGDKAIGILGSVVRDAAKEVQFILFTISDITDLIASQKENRRSKAMLTLLGQKESFVRFLGEFKTQLKVGVEAIGNDAAKVKIILHTIKGNAASFGLDDVAHLVHEIEEKADIGPEDFKEIEYTLKEFLHINKDVLSIPFEGSKTQLFTVTNEQLDELMTIPDSNDTPLLTRIGHWVKSAKRKRAKSLLGPLEELVKRTADKLAKNVGYQLTGGDTKVDPKIFGPVVNVLPHIIRNAIDHGIENPEDRGSKPEKAALKVSLTEDTSIWRITISDDGKGIDHTKLVNKAVSNKLISQEEANRMSEKEALHLIFRELSTADAVTDISGRGVGLGAVKQTVEDIGGRIEVNSVSGQSTTFQIDVPKEAVQSQEQRRTA